MPSSSTSRMKSWPFGTTPTFRSRRVSHRSTAFRLPPFDSCQPPLTACLPWSSHSGSMHEQSLPRTL